MPCYIVSYDLHTGGDYEDLIAAIKSYGTWAHITESTWAVVTKKSASDIRTHLGSYMKAEDRILIVRSGVESAWANAICKDTWLYDNL